MDATETASIQTPPANKELHTVPTAETMAGMISMLGNKVPMMVGVNKKDSTAVKAIRLQGGYAYRPYNSTADDYQWLRVTDFATNFIVFDVLSNKLLNETLAAMAAEITVLRGQRDSAVSCMGKKSIRRLDKAIFKSMKNG